MILYFFASYSLYVALCFSVVNKRKAPSHLLSAPRSPPGAALSTDPSCPKLQEANPARQTLARVTLGGWCFLRVKRHPNPGQIHSLNSSLPFLRLLSAVTGACACLQEAGTHWHQEQRIKWQKLQSFCNSFKEHVPSTQLMESAPSRLWSSHLLLLAAPTGCIVTCRSFLLCHRS